MALSGTFDSNNISTSPLSWNADNLPAGSISPSLTFPEPSFIGPTKTPGDPSFPGPIPTSWIPIPPPPPPPPATPSAVSTSSYARDATTANKAILDYSVQKAQQSSLAAASTPAPATTTTATTEQKPTTMRDEKFYDSKTNRMLSAEEWQSLYGSAPGTKTNQTLVAPNYNDAVAALDTDLKNALDTLKKIYDGSDPLEQRLINDIHEQYAARRQRMEQTNRALVSGLTTAGIRSGRARYATELQDSLLSAEERAGIMRLSELDSQERSDISKAQQAYRAGKLQEFNTRMELVEKTRSAKSELLQKQFENSMSLEKRAIERSQEARAERKDAREEVRQLIEDVAAGANSKLVGMSDEERVSYIQDLADSYGIDPDLLASGIQKYNDERNKSVRDAIINLAQDFPDAGITDADLSGNNIENVIKLVSQSPTWERKTAKERAEINKLLAEAAKAQREASGMMDESTVAYFAEQLATTGKLPPGAPKGSQGVINELAKMIAAERVSGGAIVDKTTGIKKDLGAAKETALGAAYGILQSIPELKQLLGSVYTYPGAGVAKGTARLFGLKSTESEAFDNLVENITSLFALSRSGVAVSEQEWQRLRKLLPSENSLNTYNLTDLNQFEDAFKTLVKSNLENDNATLKGVDFTTNSEISSLRRQASLKGEVLVRDAEGNYVFVTEDDIQPTDEVL